MCATTYLKAALISLPAHARTEQRSSCIMISVVLSVKMKIVMQKKKKSFPEFRESYRNRNICQNNHNWIFFYNIMQP